MPVHVGQDIAQESYALGEVRPLVQHDAFGALRHGRIRHFRTRGDAVANELVEDLGRRDHRRMSGLAKPENFLLHLGKPSEPISTAKSPRAIITPVGLWAIDCRMQAWQIADRDWGFDLQDDRLWRKSLPAAAR